MAPPSLSRQRLKRFENVSGGSASVQGAEGVSDSTLNVLMGC